MESVEQFLSKLNQMRKDLEADPEDEEWVVLHHSFCFISYQINDFKKYWKEVQENRARKKSD
ncbi:MAG: hypothetical protein HYU36_09200 [Planctomycetes bacterium]|nr:hypothetical protein [Planctomycetota bacterium]